MVGPITAAVAIGAQAYGAYAGAKSKRRQKKLQREYLGARFEELESAEQATAEEFDRQRTFMGERQAAAGLSATGSIATRRRELHARARKRAIEKFHFMKRYERLNVRTQEIEARLQLQLAYAGAVSGAAQAVGALPWGDSASGSRVGAYG